MEKTLTLIVTLLMATWPFDAWSFSCEASQGLNIPVGGGTSDVYMFLKPSLEPGQNMVFDLSEQIFCRNTVPGFYTDYIKLVQGSSFSGLLGKFSGKVRFNYKDYPFPLTTDTSNLVFDTAAKKGLPIQLYLTPLNNAAASGVVIPIYTHVATFTINQTNNVNGDSANYTWRIFSYNNVIIPTGTCDVSARNITVTLPDYPGSVPIPLSVHCNKNQSLSYSLSGTTGDTAGTVFSNTSSLSPAKGIGVQLLQNGTAIPVNRKIPLGMVGTSAVDLNLTASYGRTNGQITAGNVRSIIGLTFTYN